MCIRFITINKFKQNINKSLLSIDVVVSLVSCSVLDDLVFVNDHVYNYLM